MSKTEKVKRKLRQSPVDRLQDQLDRWKNRSAYPVDQVVAQVVEGQWEYRTEAWEDDHPGSAWTMQDARAVILDAVQDSEAEAKAYVEARVRAFIQEYFERSR